MWSVADVIVGIEWSGMSAAFCLRYVIAWRSLHGWMTTVGAKYHSVRKSRNGGLRNVAEAAHGFMADRLISDFQHLLANML